VVNALLLSFRQYKNLKKGVIKMELKVNAVSVPEAITFNYEELKAELLQKVSHYESLVYTPDQIREAKSDRANLNRLKKALNDERLKREREYMQPFMDFNGKIAEIISIIDKPVSVIDQQIKEAEERAKAERLEAIEAYYNSHPGMNDRIRLNQFMDPKWLNASTSVKSIQEAIDAKIQQFEKDLAVVKSLPLYAFEAEECYLDTLDLAIAVSEAHGLQDMAEKKAAFEAERAKAEEMARNAVQNIPEQVVTEPDKPVCLHTEPRREWVRFQAFMTPDEARALGQYLRNNGIKYKAV
jgi:DNA repair exonuclease SbcCD ATPase subunit